MSEPRSETRLRLPLPGKRVPSGDEAPAMPSVGPRTHPADGGGADVHADCVPRAECERLIAHAAEVAARTVIEQLKAAAEFGGQGGSDV